MSSEVNEDKGFCCGGYNSGLRIINWRFYKSTGFSTEVVVLYYICHKFELMVGTLWCVVCYYVITPVLYVLEFQITLDLKK